MIDKVIVHCSATPASMDIGVDEIARWHTDPKPKGNGWSAIGYSYVIRRDGTVEKGRDRDGDGDVENEIGAHTRGFNRNSIGICMVGGVNEKGRSDSNFTLSQYKSLAFLVEDIKTRHDNFELLGHRDLDPAKDCPCFDVKAFFGE